MEALIATCYWAADENVFPAARLAELTVVWLMRKSSRTRVNYLTCLRSWWQHSTGHPFKVDAFSVLLWLDRHSYRWTPDRPAASAVQHLSVVSSWYKFMIEQGACHANPAGQVRAPPARTPRPSGPVPAHVVDPGASAAAVEVAFDRTRRLDSEAAWCQATAIALLFYTGMSVEQVAAADMRDVLGRDQSEGPLTLWTGEQPPRPRSFQELGADLSAALRAYLTLRAERVGRPIVLLSGPLLAAPKSRRSPRDRVVTCARIDQMVRTALERGGIALPQRVRTVLTPAANAADPVPPATLLTPPISRCTSPPA
ncbi:hypothetical protein [Nonomuraea sp. NPDC001699]